MDARSKELRRTLRNMAPSLSIPLIRSFQLPEEEEQVLIECEARGKSVQQVEMSMNLSAETVWRRRKRALKKIANT